mmetsp:Transcript_34636/g.89831  ORF Transcript_34636/g.89831 Transcript_34636/m.89831 type:complete len:208 (+) Transcript_34636:274-897(+)
MVEAAHTEIALHLVLFDVLPPLLFTRHHPVQLAAVDGVQVDAILSSLPHISEEEEGESLLLHVWVEGVGIQALPLVVFALRISARIVGGETPHRAAVRIPVLHVALLVARAGVLAIPRPSQKPTAVRYGAEYQIVADREVLAEEGAEPIRVLKCSHPSCTATSQNDASSRSEQGTDRGVHLVVHHVFHHSLDNLTSEKVVVRPALFC